MFQSLTHLFSTILTTMKPDVSIIIVNYNSSQLLAEAIESILEHVSGIDYEVIVVDNASTDHSKQMLSERFADKCRLIALSENKGFAYANNRGIEVAEGRNILFLNPDTKQIGNAIKQLSDYLDKHPEVGACGGNLITETGGEQFSYWPILPGLRFEIHALFSNILLKQHHRGSLQYNHTGKEKEVGYIIGADLMVRREIIEQTGVFSEDFFLFYEETELCWRIRKRGYKIVSVPAARMIHLESRTIGSQFDRLPYMQQSRRIYLSKCVSRAEHRAADCILYVNSWLRWVYFSMRSDKDKIRFWRYINRNI